MAVFHPLKDLQGSGAKALGGHMLWGYMDGNGLGYEMIWMEMG